MLSFFFLLSQSLNPIILVPPMYGSKLFATYDKDKADPDLAWYCPRRMQDELFWVKPSLVIPPMINCLLQLLEMRIDPKTQKIVSRPNTEVITHDFGGESSVDYPDSGIFGFHWIETFASFFEYFKSKGYTTGKDIFAAPYDWRKGVFDLEDFWPQYRSLIKEASVKNDGKKVTLFAYSTGGYITQLFLSSNDQLNKECKEKYVASVIYLAPSFGGITVSYDSIFRHYNPLLPIIRNTYMTNMIIGLPVLYNHFPNHVIFNKTKIIIGPNGESYGPSEMPQLLLDHNKLFGDGPEFLRRSVEISKNAPRPGGVPTIFLYNSAIETFFNLDFSRGWDSTPKISYVPGDGTIAAKGPQWACENWVNWKDELYYTEEERKNLTSIENKVVHCIDMKFKDVDHVGMAANNFIHQLAYNFTNNQEWFYFNEESDWEKIYQRKWD